MRPLARLGARAVVLPAFTIFLCLPRAAQAAEFVLVGTHPDAAAQPTSTGKVLAALEAFNGKIYAGFGDYNANTGRIGIRPFNPATNTFGSLLLNDPTEAVYQFRLIGGKLYAPDIDPIAGESSGGYAVGTVNGATESWQHKAPVTAVHMYDMAGYGGSLWMCGAQGNNAVVWRSADGGTTWSVSLSAPPSGGYTYVRIYGMGVYGDKLYAQVDAETTKSRVFDGATWSDGPDLTPSGGFISDAKAFAGRLVYRSYEAGLGAASMYAFDGASASSPLSNMERMFDCKVDADVLYALVGEYVSGGSAGLMLDHIDVKWTRDLTGWQTIATAPIAARSMALLGDQLFLGATNAQLYKYSEPVPEPLSLAVLATGALAVSRRRGTTRRR